MEGLLFDALEYIKHDDYARALRCYQRAADLGSAEALFELGRASYYGYFTLKVDVANAREYFVRAAKMGHANAIAMISCPWLNDLHVDNLSITYEDPFAAFLFHCWDKYTDEHECLLRLKAFADDGNLVAQSFYHNEIDEPENAEEHCMKYILPGALHGWADLQCSMYCVGPEADGLWWVKKAVANGYLDAMWITIEDFHDDMVYHTRALTRAILLENKANAKTYTELCIDQVSDIMRDEIDEDGFQRLYLFGQLYDHPQAPMCVTKEMHDFAPATATYRGTRKRVCASTIALLLAHKKAQLLKCVPKDVFHIIVQLVWDTRELPTTWCFNVHDYTRKKNKR